MRKAQLRRWQCPSTLQHLLAVSSQKYSGYANKGMLASSEGGCPGWLGVLWQQKWVITQELGNWEKYNAAWIFVFGSRGLMLWVRSSWPMELNLGFRWINKNNTESTCFYPFMHVFLYQQSEHKAKFSCPGQTTFFPFYLSRKDAQFCPQEKDPFLSLS